MTRTIVAIYFSFIAISTSAAWNDRPILLSENNEYGGQTVEYKSLDYSYIREYFDMNGERVKVERFFSSEYPIANGLEKRIAYFKSDKKIKEEKIFTVERAKLTMIVRSVEHFDGLSGDRTRREEYYTRNYMGYSILFYKGGKKDRIERFYPNRNMGIVKSIGYIDEGGNERKTVHYFAYGTSLEDGFYKRIYYKKYNYNKYLRKYRQEWFYTDEYAKSNGNIHRKLERFLYSQTGGMVVQTNFFDIHDKLIEVPNR